MAKHKWKKHKKLWWERTTNPCAEIPLGNWQVGQDFRINDDNRLFNFTHGIAGDPIDFRQIGQATALVRPGGTVSSNAGGSAAGIEPAFSDVYRRRMLDPEDPGPRGGYHTNAAADIRSTVAESARANGRTTQRINRERSYGAMLYESLDGTALRDTIRNGNVFIPSPEESSAGRELAQFYQGDRHREVRGNVS